MSTCDPGDYSSRVPLYAPPLLAFLSAIVRGVCGFGDGICFQALWQLAAGAALLPGESCWTARKTVLYSTLMQTLTMPIQLWQSRKYLRRIMWYTLPMISIDSSFVVLGSWVLLNLENSALKPIIGVFFLVLSTLSLLGRGWSFLSRGLEAAAAPGAGAGAANNAPKPSASASEFGDDEERAGLTHNTSIAGTGMTIDTGAIVLLEEQPGNSSASSSSSSSGTSPASTSPRERKKGGAGGVGAFTHSPPRSIHSQGGESDEGEEDLDPWVPPLPTPEEIQACIDAAAVAAAAASAHKGTLKEGGMGVGVGGGGGGGGKAPWLPALSPTFSPLSMLALLLPASIFGGLLGGMMGTGGPPLMLAYSLLELDKEVLRGFAVVPSVSMLVRLALYTGSDGSVFEPSGEMWMYLGILVGAISGTLVGTRLRVHVNTEGVIAVILSLVFLASALMLGVGFQVGTTALYAILVVLGVGGFCTLHFHPTLFAAIHRGVRAWLEKP